MNFIVFLSILVVLVAIARSLPLRRAVRDGRMIFLTLMLLVMAAQKTYAVWALWADSSNWSLTFETDLTDWLELVIAGTALGLVFLLEIMLTERRQTQRQLQQTRNELAIILESLPVASYTAAADGTNDALYVSSNITALTGHAPADFTSRPDFWESRLHPDDRAIVQMGLTDSIQRGYHEHEYRWRIADGSYRWFYDFFRVVRNPDGSPKHLIGMWQDITARKEAEIALRDSEQFYQSLVQNLPQNIFRKDLEGRVTFANHQLCATLQRTVDETIGHTDYDFYPAALAEKYQSGDRSVVESGETFEAIEENQTADGKKITVQVVKTPLRDWNGKISGVQGIFWDISQRIEAERALRESEEKYRNLVERANDGICIVQVEMVAYANEQLANIGGYSIGDVIDSPFMQYIHADEAATVIENYERHMSGEEPHQRYESTLVHKQGHAVDVEINASLITYQDGPASLVFVRDITEQKRTEEQLLLRDAALAHVTRLRTMGEMVAGIAHEINQPLYAISNFAAACGRTLKSSGTEHHEQLQEWTRQITEQATRAGEIIRRLGNFSRKTPAPRSQNDVNVLVREAVELMATELRRYRVRVDLDLDPSLPAVTVDNIQIQQVLVNLLSNACEAMTGVDVGSRVVRIETRVEENRVVVTVADKGTGLPADGADTLFDAFYTTKEDGMGMGLAISRTIIEAHAGKIEARSNQDGGATLEFALPVDKGA